jgi:hypothetical protein
MIIFSRDKSTLLEVQAFSRAGSNLLLKGKIMGAMPMSAILTPSQARAALRMLGPRMILFILSLPFRRDRT